MAMVRLGDSDGQSKSKVLSSRETGSSIADGSKHKREALPFSSFKQRWAGEKQTVARDGQKSLASLRGMTSEHRGVGSLLGRSRTENAGTESPLSKLKEMRQREARTGSRTSSGVISRSNFSLAERLTQARYGKEQPLFQHRRTAASQLREIKQISRDGSIVTKTSQASLLKQEKATGTKPCALTGALKEDSLSRRGSGSRISRGDATSRVDVAGSDRSSDENSDCQTDFGSKLKSRKYERSYGEYVTRRSESSKRFGRGEAGVTKNPGASLTDTAAKASELLQRILNDKSRPFPSLPIDPSLEGKEEHEVKSNENTEQETKSSYVSIQEKSEQSFKRLVGDTQVQQTSALAQRIEKKVLQIQEDSSTGEVPNFQRSREIASKIFQKLDSKKNIEEFPALQRLTKRKPEDSSAEEQNKVERGKGAEKPGDVKEHGEKLVSDHNQERRTEGIKENVVLKIHKTKAINIPPALSHATKRKESAEVEVKITKAEMGENAEHITASVGFPNETSRVESETTVKGAHSKTGPVNTSPALLPKPKSPKSSFVIGSTEKITVSVEHPKEDEEGENASNALERCESSVEEPAQMSVASLRSSLFGSSSSSLSQILNRGMGGTLGSSPVLLRKQLMAERRQVVSSVEITQHGKAAMSMAQMSFRVETKSGSDSAISSSDPGLLPTLFTRFEKPKKPKTSPKPRSGSKTGLEPVTLQVKLADEDGKEGGQ